jgi:hypothetical protein
MSYTDPSRAPWIEHVMTVPSPQKSVDGGNTSCVPVEYANQSPCVVRLSVPPVIGPSGSQSREPTRQLYASTVVPLFGPLGGVRCVPTIATTRPAANARCVASRRVPPCAGKLAPDVQRSAARSYTAVRDGLVVEHCEPLML